MMALKREMAATDPREAFIRHVTAQPHVHGGQRK